MKPEPDPSTVLLACFLSTSSIALVAQAGKKDLYQPYIVGFCAMISAIVGTLSTADVQDFVFVYLFWGCLGGLGVSIIVHRFIAVTIRKPRNGLKGGANVHKEGST